MRTILSMILCSVVLIQLMPISMALAEIGDDEGSADATPMAPSELSPGGAKLNALWLSGPRATGIPLSYDDVLLVINDASQMSKDIGNYFLAHRPIPQANVCNFTTSTSEHINQATFDTSVRPGVEACLNKNGLKDKINFIVTTKGFPLGISGVASVDSELSLILGKYNGSIGNSGRIKNPYFDQDVPFTHAQFDTYLVTRLTGYDLNDIKRLVDLADNSTGKRGLFLLDEGAKGGGYAIGDTWINDANTTLVNKGFNTSHDKSGTFQMHYKNVSGYASWGSNDGNYGSAYGLNYGMETDANSDNIPDNWVVENDGGSWSRVSTTAQSGTYSVRVVRPGETTGESIVGQNITILPNTRYWLTGAANVSSISNPGGGAGAHLFIRAYNSANKLVATFNSSAVTGNRNWYWPSQVHYEPVPGVSKIMIGASVFKSSGTAYFDQIYLSIIKPNNTYVPGAIGETYVSTGGRSFTYPTDYGQSLVVDLIREGISGVSGHVYEPYLDACAHPDILFDRYTSAYTMAESFWNALYYLSWMEVVAGDPKMVPYWNIPDPMVDPTNFTVTPSDPATGEEVKIKARIFGKGETVSNVEVEFYNGVPSPANRIGGTRVIASLARGSEVWLEANYTFDQVKTTTINVVVDPASKIRELNENNNKASKDVVIGYRPDLEVTQTDIALESTDVLQGHMLGVGITASNVGGVSTNLTGWANVTASNGTVVSSIALKQDLMAGGTSATLLDTDIDTAALAGDNCINVTVISSRPEDNLVNNAAGACFFVKHLNFALDALTSELTVPPLDYREHKLNITNLANVQDRFIITHEESSPLWGVDLSDTSVDIVAGATITIKVKTLTTMSVRFGDRLEVKVSVMSEATSLTKNVTFVSTAGPTYEVALTLDDSEFEAAPGAKVSINMTIGNLGNSEDNISMSATTPSGWDVAFDQPVTVLQAGQNAVRKATVTVPSDAEAAEVGDLVFTASSGKGTSTMSAMATITVTPRYELFLTICSLTVVSGRSASCYFTLENRGNTQDTIVFEASPPTFLSLELPGQVTDLASGKNKTDLILFVTASKSANPGTYPVTLKAKSLSGQVFEADMSIKVIRPEHTIKISKSPNAKVKDGTKVSFTVEVLSTGEYQPDKVNVSFSAGSRLIETQQASFNGTQKAELTFEWKATAGKHNVVFTVDPEGSMTETNESDNEAIFQLTVESRSIIGGGNGGNVPTWAVVSVIVVVAVAYLGVRTFIWSRRLKAAAREGEERRAQAKTQSAKQSYPDEDLSPSLSSKEPPQQPKTETPKEVTPVEGPKPQGPSELAKLPEPQKAPAAEPPLEKPQAQVEVPAPAEDSMSNLEKLMKEMNEGK